MAGVAATRASTSLAEKILDKRCSGNWTQSLSCYEQAVLEQPGMLGNHLGLLECQMNLGHLESCVSQASGIISRRPTWLRELNSVRVEAAWKLGHWDDLREFLQLEFGETFDTRLGSILSAASGGSLETFNEQLLSARSDIMDSLSTLSLESGSYQRGYMFIVRLQMLQEAEAALVPLLTGRENPNKKWCDHLRKEWHCQLEVTQQSAVAREAILSNRRALLSLAESQSAVSMDKVSIAKLFGDCWLQTAATARKAGLLEKAYSAILQASNFEAENLPRERATLAWECGDRHEALQTLQDDLKMTPQAGRGSLAFAKSTLLVAEWMKETARFEAQDVVAEMNAVIKIQPAWEGGYFALAKYVEYIPMPRLMPVPLRRFTG